MNIDTETVISDIDYQLENNLPNVEPIKSSKKEMPESPMFYIVFYGLCQIILYTFYICIGNIYVNTASLFAQTLILFMLCFVSCDAKCTRETINLTYTLYSILTIQIYNIAFFSYLTFYKSKPISQDN
jgi:hypothetical protein